MTTELRANIGKDSLEKERKHQGYVYNVILYLGKPTVKEIRKCLDEQNVKNNQKIEREARLEYENMEDSLREKAIERYIRKYTEETISERTIQRCIEKLKPRGVKRDGWRYFIDIKAKYEKRYQYPKRFGDFVYMDFMDKAWPDISTLDKLSGKESESDRKWLEFHMKEMMTRLGVFMTLMFIEASKPFKNKSLTLNERKDLVDYWIQNAIPIDSMFRNVLHIFSYFRFRQGMDSYQGRNGVARYELEPKSIRKAYSMIKKIYPKLYDEWVRSVNNNEKKYEILGKLS